MRARRSAHRRHRYDAAMDLLTQSALAAGLAWGSGLRLYAVLFLCGSLQRLGYVQLPGELTLLAHDWVLVASGVMLVGEFIADKVPAFDSAWDALHTFIRIPGGMLLAWGAFAEQGPAAQLAAGIVGGAITSSAHFTKAGTRALINHSPEPFSNWFASFSEEGLLLMGLWLAFQHPVLFLLLLVLFVLLMLWLLPRLWRALRWSYRQLRERFGSGARGPALTDSRVR